ncbi:MAG: ribonuclease Z [Methanomicrobiales archaeon]|nr:ribonuclease Z [Methanomicrobiales archaeon]
MTITITLHGTNGWYTSKTGCTTCLTIDTPDYFIILDAGEGFSKIPDKYPSIQKPAFLFLSHFHLDHISGFHTLARCKFERGLRIFGPPGVGMLTSFIGYPFTIPIGELPYTVSIEECSKCCINIPFTVITAGLVHNQPVNGYRFELEKTIAFCTDTGPCEGIVNLGADADLLITECSYLPGQDNPGWPHLNPEIALDMAEKARARELALVHFAADLYVSIEQRLAIKKISHAFSKVIIGQDDMEIHL